MDVMNIKSGFMTNVISKLAKKALKKKLGYDVDIKLNQMNATIVDGKAHVHLDIDADIDKDEFMKILKNIGLN